MQRALAEQAAAIRASTPGVRRGDAEALHAWRVAVRRLRTLLRALPAGRLRRTDAATLQQGWRAWAARLGPARDADVWRAALAEPRLRATLSATPAGRRFLAAQERRHRAAKQQQARVPADPSYTRLLARTQRLLAAGLPADLAALGARRLEKSVRRAFRRLLAEARRRGRRLTRAERLEEIHALRRAVRRARYLAELCRALLPRGACRLRHELAAVQETLGDVHDADVQLERLRALPPAAARRARHLILGRRRRAWTRYQAAWAVLLFDLRTAK
jgi:CHAD domain-containing protein